MIKYGPNVEEIYPTKNLKILRKLMEKYIQELIDILGNLLPSA